LKRQDSLPSVLLTHLKAVPHRLAAGSSAKRLVGASRICDAAEAARTVADDGWRDRGCVGPVLDLLALEAFDPTQLHARALRRPGGISVDMFALH